MGFKPRVAKREEWTPMPTEPVPSTGKPYSVDALRTFSFNPALLGPPEGPYYMRFEYTRVLIAKWLNFAKVHPGEPIKGRVIDIWVGQVCDRGIFQPEMFIAFAATKALPDPAVFDSLRQHKSFLREWTGVHPVTDAGVPQMRLTGLQGPERYTVWELNIDFMLWGSRRYRAVHGLAPQTRDPYIQMTTGVPEPRDFLWKRVMGEPAAIETFPNAYLSKDLVPDADATWDDIYRFAATYLPFEDHDTIDDAYTSVDQAVWAWENGLIVERIYDLADLRSIAAIEATQRKLGRELEGRDEFLRYIVALIRDRCPDEIEQPGVWEDEED